MKQVKPWAGLLSVSSDYEAHAHLPHPHKPSLLSRSRVLRPIRGQITIRRLMPNSKLPQNGCGIQGLTHTWFFAIPRLLPISLQRQQLLGHPQKWRMEGESADPPWPRDSLHVCCGCRLAGTRGYMPTPFTKPSSRQNFGFFWGFFHQPLQMSVKHLHSTLTETHNYAKDSAACNLRGQEHLEGRGDRSLFLTWLDGGGRTWLDGGGRTADHA